MMSRNVHSQSRPAGRPRRFSEGIERMPFAPSNARVGRFSDGLERSPRSAASDRVGSFADGIVHDPEAPATLRVGSFADGYAPSGASAGGVGAALFPAKLRVPSPE